VAQATTTSGDYWVGYRFTPRLIAAAGSGVWVVENHLPLLARVDPRSGAASGPHQVGHGDPAGRGAHDLLASGGALWIRWNDGISRFAPESGEERWIELAAAGLAAGDAGVWALTGDGRLARVDPDGTGFEPVGDPEVRRHSIAVGHGAVWTLTWTHVPGGSTVARVDPATGRVEAQLPIQGSPRQLMVDRDAVYVRVWRRDERDTVEESLLSVDPSNAQQLAAARISPAGAGGAVRERLFWSPDADPYAHDEPSARCFNARTGELLATAEVPGWITAVAAGQDGVWACLERRGEPGGGVVELTPEGDGKTVDLSGLDVSEYLRTTQPR
jgi:outer membrane protein assembly factor BamB